MKFPYYTTVQCCCISSWSGGWEGWLTLWGCGKAVSNDPCLIVCRDGEVRRGNADSATLEICLEDEWLAPTNSLQVAMGNSPVTNIQLIQETLSWSPPATDENILRYDITCFTSDSDRLMWSLLGNSQTSTTLHFLLPQAMYTCCVTTITQGRMGVEFTSEACQGGLVVTTPPTTTPTTPTTCPPTPGCSTAAESILVLVLGVLAGLFFLALLIVSCALLVFMRAAAKGKKASYETNGMAEYEMKM